MNVSGSMMNMYDNIPDNYEIWEAHERELERRAQEAEHCAWCGRPIYDAYYDISGDMVCEECVDGCRRYV